jgi:hypothetical protein
MYWVLPQYLCKDDPEISAEVPWCCTSLHSRIISKNKRKRERGPSRLTLFPSTGHRWRNGFFTVFPLSNPVLVGTIDYLQRVNSQATVKSVQLPTDGPSQQIHVVGEDLIVVFRVLLEFAQATSTQTGSGAVQLAQNRVGEMSEPHGLLTDLRGCGGRDLRMDGVHQGTIVLWPL